MCRALTHSLIRRTVRFAPQLPLVYLDNSKAASQTIKLSLWLAVDRKEGNATFAGAVEDRRADPFVKDVFSLSPGLRELLSKSVVFSVVRNPFTRILSAYLNKICGRTRVRAEFVSRFGIRTDLARYAIRFVDFLRIVSTEPDELLDPSFRSQTSNLLVPFSVPHFLGRVEEPMILEQFLHSHGVELKDSRPHSTTADLKVAEHYDSESVDIVRRRYADDFRVFGYSDALENIGTPMPLPAREDRVDRVLEWLATGRAPLPQLDPPCRAFHEFRREKSRSARLAIIAGVLDAEYNWARLFAYAEFALERNEPELARSLLMRCVELRAAHLSIAENDEIFLPDEQTVLREHLLRRNTGDLRRVAERLRERIEQDKRQKRRNKHRSESRLPT